MQRKTNKNFIFRSEDNNDLANVVGMLDDERKQYIMPQKWCYCVNVTFSMWV